MPVSIVFPCLNEVEGLQACLPDAIKACDDLGLTYELIVADNGSTDRSASMAEAMGATVVQARPRGYGYAIQAGVRVARYPWIIMADADGSYPFCDGFTLYHMTKLLDLGEQVIIGNRFKGRMMAGAMPWTHRYLGNPILSGLLRVLFHAPIGDAHCGMRAFTRDAWEIMHCQTGGMEFASEMVVRAVRAGLRISEVRVNYHPRIGTSKLHPVRDAWRHVRFLLKARVEKRRATTPAAVRSPAP